MDSASGESRGKKCAVQIENGQIIEGELSEFLWWYLSPNFGKQIVSLLPQTTQQEVVGTLSLSVWSHMVACSLMYL